MMDATTVTTRPVLPDTDSDQVVLPCLDLVMGRSAHKGPMEAQQAAQCAVSVLLLPPARISTTVSEFEFHEKSSPSVPEQSPPPDPLPPCKSNLSASRSNFSPSPPPLVSVTSPSPALSDFLRYRRHFLAAKLFSQRQALRLHDGVCFGRGECLQEPVRVHVGPSLGPCQLRSPAQVCFQGEYSASSGVGCSEQWRSEWRLLIPRLWVFWGSFVLEGSQCPGTMSKFGRKESLLSFHIPKFIRPHTTKQTSHPFN